MNQILDSQIHIYMINFNEIIESKYRIKELLVDDEIERVNKLKFESDKQRALKTYFIRRKILSAYTDISPEKIIFKYNTYGKPYFTDGNNFRIKFNYSHSQDLLLFAICLDNEIGVDLEFIKVLPDLKNLAENYFSQKEFCYYQSFKSPEEKLFFFYKIWTRKEALLKAIGTGLIDGLKVLNVLDGSAVNNSSLIISYYKKKLIITDIMVPENFIGSLAYVSKIPKELIYFDSLT
uniref:4'-phosphopantetheinyl transferase superfamily protein n=1 Tax=Ignavibacterium album TaxID=591197 RepID=A0A7V2ZIA3_9BACT